MKDCLRWMAVLPGATLSSILVSGIATAIGWAVACLFPNSWSPHIIFFVQCLCAPAAFVQAGGLIAPRYRFWTAGILAALYIAIMALYVAGMNAGLVGKSPMWWLMVCFFLCLSSLAFGFEQVYEVEMKRRYELCERLERLKTKYRTDAQ